ncbi:GntR family transcriptional regulator [Pseudoroseomonas wenyumeiae]
MTKVVNTTSMRAMAQPDPDPTAPRYQQIKSFILDRVRSGEWSAEHRVPSENELVRLTGHSRVTVGRALRELADAGLLKRVQGVGTFVASGPPQSALLELRDIAMEIAERGHAHGTRVEALGRRLADAELAVAFGVPEGSSSSTAASCIWRTACRCSWKIGW